MRWHVKLLLLVAIVRPVEAIEVAGVIFPDQLKVDSTQLSLNGVGLRTATVFKVKVYAAALYLKAKATEAQAVLDAPYPKQLQMEFLREFEGKDMATSWDHSFNENCEKECEGFKASLDALKALMVTVKKGDRMVYTFRDNSLELVFNGVKKGEITAKGFSRAILSTWIGKNPPTEVLKKGLLGLTEP